MYKQDDWNDIVKLFIYDLSKDVSLDQALQYFASNYTEICQRFEEECSEDTFEENEEESLDVYFERKMKPMWDYVYDLQKQINTIQMHQPFQPKPLVSPYTPPNVGNPYSIPNHLDWYQVKCANGNVPLGNDAAKVTPEELEAWSNIRFDDPAKRR